jgi:membrane protein YqaA with SNARE-associated domain
VAFAWGFAEATFFFIVPDVIATLTALFSPRQALRQVALIVLGAIVGGLIMFSWSSHFAGAREFVAAVPRVHPAMFDQAQTDLKIHGAIGAVFGPSRGIPYKVYAVQAPQAGIGLGSFALASIPARAWRLIIFISIFSVIGYGLRKAKREHWAVKLHALFWVFAIGGYWLNQG